MLLLVFRHGIAEDRAADGRDESRLLTPDGAGKTRQAARGLARIAPKPDVILTSPKARAAQSADILARAFGRQPALMSELADDDAAAILAKLALRHGKTVLIVGHEPSLSEVVALACMGQARSGAVEMKKAACAAVEIDDAAGHPAGAGTLLWLATPRMLRALAR